MPRQRSGRGLSSFTNYILPAACAGAACYILPSAVHADTIGLSQLRAIQPGLNGSGIRVAQVEGPEGAGVFPPDFEVNPPSVNVNQSPSLFTYYSSNGVSTTFNDSVGSESFHADDVASDFYGIPFGVATNVSHVDNYEAGFFINTVIAGSGSMAAQVINSSFAVENDQGQPIQDTATDQEYDNYVANNPTKIFVAGAGNSGAPISPATMYNGIAVGAYQGVTSTGPTSIGGRSKPDIMAPAGATSFASPQVAGAAAILLQAGQAGDGGPGTTASTQDFRVIKALLLDGAVKPAGWTHSAMMPLDPSNGAGILNIFNSYEILAAGEHGPTLSSITASVGGNYTPATNVAGALIPTSGWDFRTVTNTTSTDTINHYYFTLTSAATATATLDWELQSNQTTLNNLDLLLFNVVSGTMVAESDSLVDNVEHIYLPSLGAGEYDLEVVKRGNSGTNTGFLDTGETYGLAYNFAQTPEPTTLTGLATGAALLFTRRRRSAI
jgi:hypothetical protein